MSDESEEESTKHQVAVVAKTEASASVESVAVEATKPDPDEENSDDDNASNSNSGSNDEDSNDSDVDEEEDDEMPTEPRKPDNEEQDNNSDNESKDDDSDDSDGDQAEEEEENEEAEVEEADEGEDEDEVKASAEPTDEFGRPLSAYEIMRLERIKRNQAYLAKLGLEADSKSGKKSFLLTPHQDEMKKKAAKKRKAAKEVVVERRTSVGRRTKVKKVNYTENKIKQKIDLVSKQEKKPAVKKEKSERQKTKDNSVPLFIYREFKNMEVSRRQNIRTGEKLVRTSELQMRMANREVESLQRKERRLRDRETRDMLIPIVRQIDKRRVGIIKALRRIEPEKQQISNEELRNQAAKRLSEAEKRFPEAAQEAELSLARMFIERLPPFQNVENNNMKVKSAKSKKSKGKNADPSPDQEAKAVTVPVLPANLDVEALRKVEEGLKVRVQKSRNVGGPITANFAGAVQRKWLDGDGPIAASFNEYVPQVGDTVLYYPCAHYDFLRQYPDTRCKKNRLLLRKTLWERAVDEKKSQEQPEKPTEDDDEETKSKRKKQEIANPWWTMEWMSSIQRGAGRYPIVCKVDKVVSEFPYDQESQLEIRRFQSDAIRAKNGKGKSKRITDEEGRKKPTKNKPQMCLAVTLKPLAPIAPPTEISKDHQLSLPPIFSLLMFPTEKTPFLVPLALAFRSSLMFAPLDQVKVTKSDGTWHKAEIVSANKDASKSVESVLESFATIVKDFADSDVTAVQKIDTLISEAYSNSNNVCSIPEGDLRGAIQTILYQYHTKQSQRQTISAEKANNASVEIRTNADLLVSNIANLIQNHLPRWENVKILSDGIHSEQFICPWQLSFATEITPQEEAVNAALAPSVLVSPNRMMIAGFVHLIDESLRAQLEIVVRHLVDTDPRAFIFVPMITDAIVLEYSRFVPVPMCFRKILKRLKSQRIKYPKSSNKNGEDSVEEQGYGDSESSYYRSIEAIQSDISDVFQNCLLYNAPDSDIVLSAFHVTKLINIAIEKVADDWQKVQDMKRNAEMAQIVNAELAARGELVVKVRKKTSIPAHEVEDFGAPFHKQVDRNWMDISDGDASWLPQCGDKVIYNRMHHGKFINGHLDILNSRQRTLPSILPPSKKRRKQIVSDCKIVTNTEHGEEPIQSDMYQYWLGSVAWIRSVFPSNDAGAADDLTPLYAIGIQFHYKWLSKAIQVVYWRPCSQQVLASQGCGKENVCNKCGLSRRESFLTPAWMVSMDKILPPYPLSLAYDAKPTTIPAEDTLRIGQCFNALKERVVGGTQIDRFQARPDFLESTSQTFANVPMRFRYIFEDAEDHRDTPNQSSHALLPSTEKLIKDSFLAPWTLTGEEDDESNVATRGKAISVATDDNAILPFHETIVPNIRLSLGCIHSRLKSDYYRSMKAIVNDIREACSACIMYTIKDRIRSKRLGRNSEEIVLKAVLESCGVDIDDFLNESKPKQTSGKGQSADESMTNGVKSDANKITQQNITVDVSGFSHQERAALDDLRAIFKLHAIALMTCRYPAMAEIGLGVDVSNDEEHQGAITDDQENARRKLNLMLNSTGVDKMKFRKPIPYSDDSPTVNVIITVKDSQDKEIQAPVDNTPVDVNRPIVFEPEDYEGHPALANVLGRFQKGDRKDLKVSVYYRYMNLTKSPAIILHPKGYQKNSALSKFLKFFQSGDRVPQIKFCLVSESLDLADILEEGKDSSCNSADAERAATDRKDNAYLTEPQQSEAADGEGVQSINGLLNENQNDGSSPVNIDEHLDDSNTEEVDTSKPLQFLPSDYYNNGGLVRALFCRSKRRQVCVKCVLGKKGIFTCRVRSAHSNLDPTWIEYYRSNGGVDGILRILDPAYMPPPTLMLSHNLQDEDRDDLDATSVAAPSECGSEMKSQAQTEVSTNEENLKDLLESAVTTQKKAAKAARLAKALLSKAQTEVDLPILLSSEFMHASFNVDPQDGHFEICPKCGLGGDVICCEGCPMVSHPNCAGMAEIPDAEWHCYTCVRKRKTARNQEHFLGGTTQTSVTESCIDGVDTEDLDVEKTADEVSILLEELKQSRQKPVTVVLGQKLIREFDEEDFFGEVIGLPSDESEFFKILYEDDDEEELTLEELQPCIIAYNKVQKSTELAQEQLPQKRGRPRKNQIEEVEDETPRKMGRSRKRVLDDNSESLQPLPEKRGRPRKSATIEPIENQPKKRGRPSKRLDSSAELLDDRATRRRGRSVMTKESRKRGRPRKNASPEHEHSPVLVDRGRRRTHENASLEPSKKRGRGRPRSTTKAPVIKAVVVPEEYGISEDDSPNPGHVDKNMTYYCTMENDTSAKIASLIGCESWLEVAYIPENLERFPALQDKKVKFRKGTLVRIGECNFTKKKAALLIE